MLEPRFTGQVFKLTNFNAATVIYLRKPLSGCAEFYIVDSGGTGITLNPIICPDIGVIVKVPALGANKVERIRFFWDTTATVPLWRALQVRVF